MSKIEKLFLEFDVSGPKITFKGFGEKASIGTFKLIAVIQKIGNKAIRHQNTTNADDKNFK
tara:strand:+ start:337 stop:519 length:183 start_codon:yes stop_codon:yes gene_type:complete